EHRAVGAQDQEPEEERSLLPRPERRERVVERKILTGVLGDVAVAHVAREQGALEKDHGEEREPAHRPHRAPSAAQRSRESGAAPPGDASHREDAAAERQSQREASELAHARPPGLTTCPSPAPSPRTWTGTSSPAWRRRARGLDVCRRPRPRPRARPRRRRA